jgi:hypothetical protein
MMRSLFPFVAVVAALTLSACEEPTPEAPPVPPSQPSPPSPDLPMTGAKARQIIGDLPLPCVELASLKADMLTCDERVGRPVDHEALRTELRDLRWTLQPLPAEEAAAQCSAQTDELRAMPKPQACWDLGNG